MRHRRFTPLAHSQALHHATATRRTQPPDPDEVIEITVVVRSKTPRDKRRQMVRKLAAQLPRDREVVGPREFARHYGAEAKDLSRIEVFGKQHHLDVIEASEARRCVVFSGRLGDVDRAFRVVSSTFDHGAHTYRSHEKPVEIPDELSRIIRGVIGLDTHPLRTFAETRVPEHFTERQAVMRAYGFPEDADGTGQTIGIMAMGGGYHPDDVKDYLDGREIAQVELQGQHNDPASTECIAAFWDIQQQVWAGNDKPNLSGLQGCPNTIPWTLEVTSDIQNAARFAPGSNLVVYFAPNTMHGKYAAFTTALIDEHAPSVISCSSGLAERLVCRNHAWIMDNVFEMAALRGITICYSSGDSGDGSHPMIAGQPEHPISAQFPASSPHVLACGGTMPTRESELPEVVWNEGLGVSQLSSGGGVSETFGAPWWQSSALVKDRTGRVGRGIPDVAGKADIETGYRVKVGGIDMPVGGTSSVAPMWAALIARLNQKLGAPVGFLNALLYENRHQFEAATTSIQDGDNGAYRAVRGWDACTGWGTPKGDELYKALAGEAG